MKRVAAALALLLTAVLLTVWSNTVFTAKLNSLSASLSQLIDCSETCSDDELRKKTGYLLTEWESSSKTLHSLILHEGMDDLEQNITSLPMIIEYSDRDEYRKKCIEAVNQIANLLAAEELSFENIL